MHLPEHDFLVGGADMGRRMRAHDWQRTPLGDPAHWPESLRSALGICLGSRFPIAIYWGEDLTLLYNDAWSPIPGNKHPWALGRPAREVWPEIWDAISPLFDQVMLHGEATHSVDSLLPMHRHGYTEECYFNFTFTPIRGPGGRVAGVFNAVIETTFRVVTERRARILRELAERISASASPAEVCAGAHASLSGAGEDVPFHAIYLVDNDGLAVHLHGARGIEAGTPMVPRRIALHGPDADPAFLAARDSGEVQLIDDVQRRHDGLLAGPWPEPVREAMIAPLAGTAGELMGFLLAGASPRRAVDTDYREFVRQAASHLSRAMAAATVLADERRRAEALAEVDRVKTAFFSNVSHEFRTPLTLMLGPLEEALAGAPDGPQRERLELVSRNAQRLLKLVNALLDYSRMEAGRASASFEATDLAGFTADLASLFRSACERAGLQLEVDCPPVGELYVDRQMWEKIVFNLLSNAFKFTFEGGIRVTLRRLADCAVLSVADTGTGIPEQDVPHVFERFHRVQNARGRSYEGSGIGLALVSELTKLHGGQVAVESSPGRGSTFTVAIPFGTAHLPPGMVMHAAAQSGSGASAVAYVQEALGWLESPSAVPAGAADPHWAHVLLADDNADMRAYVQGLLAGQYAVTAVADGEAALHAACEGSFDLVLSDVMMPRLDGFGLIAALRADPRTTSLPVILLSARAGEESRTEGLAAGADDYLVKPFGARELLARVAARLEISRIRREADRRKDEFLATLSHELRNPLAPLRTSLHLLRKRQGGTDPLYEIMDRQVNQLVRLVDDLLEISRISRGILELKMGVVDVEQVIRNAIETSQPLITAGAHALRTDLPPARLHVNGDLVRLTQILANLLNNAARYTDAGGEISITVRTEGGNVKIAVRDTGMGIAPEQMPRMFEMFTRGSRSGGRNPSGLGIGLALSRQLALMHHGDLEVRSPGEGLGSEFTLVLPLADGETPNRDRAGHLDVRLASPH